MLTARQVMPNAIGRVEAYIDSLLRDARYRVILECGQWQIFEDYLRHCYDKAGWNITEPPVTLVTESTGKVYIFSTKEDM